MTNVIMKERKTAKFKDLKLGDCFLDADSIFCIKTDSTSCIYVGVESDTWDIWDDCDDYETVYPIDVEIHIVN